MKETFLGGQGEGSQEESVEMKGIWEKREEMRNQYFETIYETHSKLAWFLPNLVDGHMHMVDNEEQLVGKPSEAPILQTEGNTFTASEHFGKIDLNQCKKEIDAIIKSGVPIEQIQQDIKNIIKLQEQLIHQ
jgi:hypothetical protein